MDEPVWKQEGDDEQAVRSILVRFVLFCSQDDIKKPAKCFPVGKKGGCCLGKLMMQKPNMIMDEPTNHLDMESIESLNMALELYTGHADLCFTRP